MNALLDAGEAGTLTSYSVGTVDGREAMMVLDFARTPEDLVFGTRYKLPLAMSAELARGLGQALLIAAEAAEMGASKSDAMN
ncbi:hypothetical protein [Microvirga lenta]|uniref:hypothetical protein n=1 Tax=Microvirga lenta TaxID=2881337 RepID=UPI001CFF2FE7|nr:hypothetical protein [Microvirga lenta]MCB5173682.1 hypothetical protein [Microvirga lenta]